MSTYNETESQIRESVESMLAQTYSRFELIVINDNPKRDDVKPILDTYNDDRIRFYQNPSNIGLAMSMNKAAELASPEAVFYARMDADDIATKDRLEKNYACLSSGNYDLVFSQYYYIDKNSNKLNKPFQKVIADEELTRNISLHPVIHHPTVMFTRQIFEKVGGYRNFPCSQDLDLWFRMCEAGCRFHMIGEPLLYYRINPNSVSSKKWFCQQLTCNYIFELSVQRLKTGQDSYSIENYEKYLTAQGINNPKAENNLRNCYKDLSLAIKYKNECKFFKAAFYRLKAFMESNIKREAYMKFIEKKRMIK